MKLLLQCAARLYPRAWRKRYGDELDTLTKDLDSGWRDFFDILMGACKMQVRSMNAWRFAGLCGVVGLIVGGVFAWHLPVEYRSQATLLMPNGSGDEIEPAVMEVMGLDSRVALIRKYDLYPKDSQRLPLPEVARNMGKDIKIAIGQPELSKGSIPVRMEFAYSDGGKAQAVNSELTRRLAAAMKVAEPSQWKVLVSQPPKAGFLIGGLLSGMALGMALVGIGRWPLVPAVGLALAILVLPATFLIPNQYRSHATLRMSAGDNSQAVRAVMSDREFLKTVIVRWNLYPDRRRDPVDGVVDRMLRDLKVVAGSRPEVFSLTFTYPNRFQAQSALQGIVNAIAQKEDIEVLDRASLPEAAFTPKRGPIVLVALIVGLLGGGVLATVRGRRTLAAA